MILTFQWLETLVFQIMEILMIYCIHEIIHSRKHSFWRHLAVSWLQVAVNCYCPIELVAVTLHPKKDAKGNGMDTLTILINSIRFKSGLLCSPEHSKVCFLLHETPFAAQNSLLCRGLWLSSEVGLPIQTFQSAEPQHWCTSWRNTWCSWCRLCMR